MRNKHMKIYQKVTNVWTDWFAWRPVMTEDREIVWLEPVERRIYYARTENVRPSSWTIYKRKS